MRILFISLDTSGCDLAWRLQEEGHVVKFYVQQKKYRDDYAGILRHRITNWRAELPWVRKDGLIIFDNMGMGKTQDKLRSAGYRVVGGCQMGEMLEHNRKFGQRIFSQMGMEIVPSRTFYDFDSAIDFVKRNPGHWVIKQNGHLEKDFNYVGRDESGEDVVSVLQQYQRILPSTLVNFDLQQRINGIEIGVGRYFNGHDWVGPIEFNIEHKSLFPGDLGPKTFEMGTVMWYSDDLHNRLYAETIARMKPFLQKIKFIGDFEMNFMVNRSRIFPLEATARFGYPALQLQTQFHQSPWGEFLMALARGKEFRLKWKPGEGLVVLVAAPPFPYDLPDERFSSRGMRVLIDPDFYQRKRKQIHLEEVCFSKQEKRLVLTSDQGYALHVSSVRENLLAAQEDVNRIIQHITIPKMFYRQDIGERFIQKEKPLLKKWGLV